MTNETSSVASELTQEARKACAMMNEEICQTLGKALGYPWFKDDPKNFPDATEADGVCVGDHVAESLACEAADAIAALRARAERAEVTLRAVRGLYQVTHIHAAIDVQYPAIDRARTQEPKS